MRKHASPTIKSPHTPGRDTREIKQRRSEWRITKMVLAIFLSFVACYLPITIVKVADVEVKYPGIIKHLFSFIIFKKEFKENWKKHYNTFIYLYYFSLFFSLRISRFGLPAALLRLLREPDYLCDHEQTIQASVRGRDRMFADKGEPFTLWKQRTGSSSPAGLRPR